MAGHDFDGLTRRLESLDLADMEMATAGYVDDYPIHCIRLGGDARGRKRVLLSGGVHGDEPAGPEAVLAFLERDPADLLEDFVFLILPCVNPWGIRPQQAGKQQGSGRQPVVLRDRCFRRRNRPANVEGRAIRRIRGSSTKTGRPPDSTCMKSGEMTGTRGRTSFAKSRRSGPIDPDTEDESRHPGFPRGL